MTQLVKKLITNKGVCGTALATLGLLNCKPQHTYYYGSDTQYPWYF